MTRVTLASPKRIFVDQAIAVACLLVLIAPGLYGQTPRVRLQRLADLNENCALAAQPTNNPRVAPTDDEVALPPTLGMTRLSSIENAPNGPVILRGAWWKPHIHRTQRSTPQQLNVSLNGLLLAALEHSAKIQVISDEPLIAEQDITTADAEFDWLAFLDSRWDDTSDPVGNTLTTGGADRFRDHYLTVEMGMRRRNTLGGQFEVSQKYGHQNNNSIFFFPNNQGTSRLTLSYTQPLLRGAGRVQNTSLTVLAKVNTKIARQEFERQLQQHLLDITRGYWGLYFERGRLLQQQRLLKSGEAILAELQSREEIDALKSQVVRAVAAVEERRAELVRIRLGIRTAEARIRALVNDPGLLDTLQLELVPVEDLSDQPFSVELGAANALALQNRPEIQAALEQVKAACVRLNLAKNETLPLLNVVLETYTAGLKGNSSIGSAITAMFDEGEPGYGIGLQFERPFWNRAAKSVAQQRRLQTRRLQSQFRLTVETLKLEVEVAVHELNAAYEAIGARRRALDAAEEEVAYLLDRWQLLPTDNGSASLLLEDLLDAQERLAGAEQSLLQAELDYNLAQAGYKKATGILLQTNRIGIDRSCDCNLPRQRIMQLPADSMTQSAHSIQESSDILTPQMEAESPMSHPVDGLQPQTEALVPQQLLPQPQQPQPSLPPMTRKQKIGQRWKDLMKWDAPPKRLPAARDSAGQHSSLQRLGSIREARAPQPASRQAVVRASVR